MEVLFQSRKYFGPLERIFQKKKMHEYNQQIRKHGSTAITTRSTRKVTTGGKRSPKKASVVEVVAPQLG